MASGGHNYPEDRLQPSQSHSHIRGRGGRGKLRYHNIANYGDLRSSPDQHNIPPSEDYSLDQISSSVYGTTRPLTDQNRKKSNGSRGAHQQQDPRYFVNRQYQGNPTNQGRSSQTVYQNAPRQPQDNRVENVYEGTQAHHWNREHNLLPVNRQPSSHEENIGTNMQTKTRRGRGAEGRSYSSNLSDNKSNRNRGQNNRNVQYPENSEETPLPHQQYHMDETVQDDFQQNYSLLIAAQNRSRDNRRPQNILTDSRSARQEFFRRPLTAAKIESKSPLADSATQRERLTEQLTKGIYECMVCCESVKQDQAVWSCGLCYHVFHLGCIRKWARSSQDGEFVISIICYD